MVPVKGLWENSVDLSPLRWSFGNYITHTDRGRLFPTDWDQGSVDPCLWVKNLCFRNRSHRWLCVCGSGPDTVFYWITTKDTECLGPKPLSDDEDTTGEPRILGSDFIHTHTPPPQCPGPHSEGRKLTRSTEPRGRLLCCRSQGTFWGGGSWTSFISIPENW